MINFLINLINQSTITNSGFYSDKTELTLLKYKYTCFKLFILILPLNTHSNNIVK